MSNYFETLRKLERDRKAWSREPAVEDVPAAAESAPPAEAAAEGKPPSRVTTSLSSYELATRQGSFAQILDNLRIMSPQGTIERVVIAGVTGHEPVEAVTAGLLLQARRRNLSTAVAELVESGVRATLRLRGAAGSTSAPSAAQPDTTDKPARKPSAREPVMLDFRSGALPPKAEEWLASLSATNDLLIIEAPSLARTLDGALLARACDGLAIVVEPYVTTEEALSHVSTRAAAVGCTVLGIIMAGVSSPWPKWLERFLRGAAT